MVAGGICRSAPRQFDPRAAAAQGKVDWTEPAVTRSLLKTDEFGAPLMKQLPSIGLDVVEIEYGVYPPGFKPVDGRAFLLGRQSATGQPGDETPAIDAVLWLIPAHSARDAMSNAPTASKLRLVGATKKYDAYVDVNGAKLDRIIRDAIEAAAQQ
jgi:hypothetical protein